MGCRERGDEAGMRGFKVQGREVPRQTHATCCNVQGSQPRPTLTPKPLPPANWGRGRLGAGSRQ